MRIAELLQCLHESARVAAAADGHISVGAFPVAFFDETTDGETSLTLGTSSYPLVRERNIWDNETTFTLKLSEDVEISGANTKRMGRTLTIALKQVITDSAKDALEGRGADCLFSAHPLLQKVMQVYTIQRVFTDITFSPGTHIRIE